MNENPKGVVFRVTYNDQEPNDKVYTLRVTHLGEKVGNPFQNILKVLSSPP